jgi:hypothetical protein
MRTVVLVAAAALLLAGTTMNARPLLGAQEPIATMHQIFDAVAHLLPRSLDEERFAAPENRSETLAWLDLLVASADRLQAHGDRRDPAFQFLARALDSDVRHIRRHFVRGRYEESRFFLTHLTETCVACHSRLPDPEDFVFSDELLAHVERDELSAGERARLQVATRQFDAALQTMEQIFADPAILPASMDMAGYFVDYLTISVRVKQDLERPIPTLTAVRKREDTARYLARNLESWVASLKQLRAAEKRAPSVAWARELMATAQGQSEFAGDQEGLVYYLMASSVLYRTIEGLEPGDEMAEAYYLLGATDAASRRSYWVSQAEFFFETAIRTAPGSRAAEKAYALLEEYTVLGYSGSAGVHIPPDVQATLDALRALIDGAARI